MTNPNIELNGLIDSLLAKTRQGRVQWFATASPLTYGVAFSSSSVSIRSEKVATIPQYVLSIQNADGEEIESYRAGRLSDMHYPSLEELFMSARRRATGAEKTIARIQEELAKV